MMGRVEGLRRHLKYCMRKKRRGKPFWGVEELTLRAKGLFGLRERWAY
jgi:hypothetical protein